MLNFNVPGMTCGHCARTITSTIQEIDPAAQVSIDLQSKKVEVASSAPPQQLRAAIEGAGYEVAAEAI
jgi:copper chaperone